MKTEIESVVIVKYPKGFVASLRFNKKKFDIDIAADSHWAIYERIQSILWRNGIRP